MDTQTIVSSYKAKTSPITIDSRELDQTTIENKHVWQICRALNNQCFLRYKCMTEIPLSTTIRRLTPAQDTIQTNIQAF